MVRSPPESTLPDNLFPYATLVRSVSGARGGVGMLAIDIFSRAGYEVHAISGKADHFDVLRSLGATDCIDRHQLAFSGKPMDSARFGGALDNVGSGIDRKSTRLNSSH